MQNIRIPSFIKFMIFYAMIITIVEILKKISEYADAHSGVMTLLVFVIGGIFTVLFYLVRWGRNQFLLKYPFMVAEAMEDYNYQGKRNLSRDTIEIRCLNGKWHKERINLHFQARRNIELHRINIRFIDSNLSNVPAEILSIKKVAFNQEKDKYYTEIVWHDDKNGGLDGITREPIKVFKGEMIFLEIYPNINIPRRWDGYISLETSRKYTRQKIRITNEII